MADFPDEIFDPIPFENVSGAEYDEAKKEHIYAERLNAILNEVVALETLLNTYFKKTGIYLDNVDIVPGDPYGYKIEVIQDELNASVKALYIYPPISGRRLFLGKANRLFYSLDLSYVQNITNMPNIIFPKGNYVAWSSNTNQIMVKDFPAHLSGYNNVMTFDLYDATDSGAWFFRGASTGKIYAKILSDGTITLGEASTDKTILKGRLVLRTLASDPLHATPGDRPAGSVGEVAYYNENAYLCYNSSTPLWKAL